MSLQLVLKIPMLISGAYFHHRSLTSPNPTPDRNEFLRFTQPDSRLVQAIVRWTPAPIKAVGWIAALCESTVIITRAYSAHPLSIRILSLLTSVTGGSISSASRVRMTPEFLVAWAFLATGALIRIICYRHLGKFFTYELAIRNDHHLVTDGPYSIVRHPSYSALLMVYAGIAQLVLGRGSFLTEATGLWHSVVGRVIASILLGYWAFITFRIPFARAYKEDMVLKKEFGKQWEEWARRTPYRMVPGLY